MRVGENFCPGVLHAVPAKDGLLIRIRVPGGLIDPNQLRIVADLAADVADGTLEITSRANLQLRAIRDRDLARVVEGITAAGLLPSPQHDRVRNIVTSPLAGLGIGELIDTRPLVYELDRRLRAEAIFTELHPKFSFAIHGGPGRYCQDLDDLSLEAVDLHGAPSLPLLRLSIGGIDSGFAVTSDNAVTCMLDAARGCIRLAQEAGLPVRARKIVAIPTPMQAILDALAPILIPCPPSAPPPAVLEAPLGVLPTTQPGRVSLIPSVPLGRLTAAQAHHFAKVANEEQGDLRLAPWRGLVLGAIPELAASAIVRGFDSMGLSCEGGDGFRGIAACAGSTGCEASLADVRGDAALLAQRLRGRPVPPAWTVNLSGCDKQCARRHGAAAEFIAGPSGYTLKIDGQVAASNCSPEFALETVAALHADRLSGAAL